MSPLNDVDARVRKYFATKRTQLLTMQELAACQHGGLIGGHREEIQRIYLREILPERFRIGRGMVYGPFHRSREADIVVWDAHNYPSLPMLDHSFFFAESVRLVLECKSGWSQSEMADVQLKTRALRDIVVQSQPNLQSDIQMLQLNVESLRTGTSNHGLLIAKPHIGTAALFLSGGQTVFSEIDAVVEVAAVDDAWPDVLILVEPGYVILKCYEPDEGYMGGRGWLELYEAGSDSLLLFTSRLIELATDRVVQVEAPLELMQYAHSLRALEPVATINFPLTRIVPRVAPIWSHTDES